MALVVKDRVRETTTTTGTGTVTLAGAVAGFQSFSVIGNGNTTYYTITNNVDWEVGIGTYTSSGTTLSRDTILESSNGGTAVNFGAGTKDVFVTYPAEKSVYQDGASIAAGTSVLAVANGGTGVTTSTGTGSVVLSTSPTLVTPTLGAASATSIANGLGAVGTPSYTFTGDTNTGMWSPSADTAAFSTAGSERMRIDSSGNVSIGTTTGYGGYGSGKGLTLSNQSSLIFQNASNTWNSTTAGGAVTYFSDNNMYIDAKDSGSNVIFRVNGASERMRIDSSGNVGIGTSSPATKLNVIGDIQLSRSTTASDAAINFGSNANNYIYSGNSTNLMAFATNGSERLRIDSSGNVGIGTSSPGAKLEAQTTGAYSAYFQTGVDQSSNVALRRISLTAINFRAAIQGQSLSGTWGADDLLINPSGGNVGIGTSSPSHKLDVQGSGSVYVRARSLDTTGATIGYVGAEFAGGSALQMRAGLGYTYLVSTGASDPLLFGTNTTERMRVDSSGNVGIGTSSPGVKLDVAGSVRVSNTSSVQFRNAAGTAVAYMTLQSDDNFVVYNAAGTPIYSFTQGATNFAIYGSNANNRMVVDSGTPVTYWTVNGSERMRINSSGNVGIGTSSPGTRLQVRDAAAPSGFSSTSVRVTRDNYGADFVGYIDQGVGHGAIISTVNNGTPTERMRIDSSGNVGIGTGAPLSLLHVAGDSNPVVLNQNTSGSTATFTALGVTEGASFGVDATGAYITSSASAVFSTNYTERMRITSSGNVGIGTSSPGQKLTVAGTVESTSGGFKFPDGTTQTTGVLEQVDVYTTIGSTTWTKPSWAKSVQVILIGGGGGGGSGRKGVAGTLRTGGAGGGGGAFSTTTLRASYLGSTVTVTVGGGGAGGASQTVNSTNGNAGTNGGTSSFGTILYAPGGSGGGGGSASGGTPGAFARGTFAGGQGGLSSSGGGSGSGITATTVGFNGGAYGGAGGGSVTVANANTGGGQGVNTASSTAPGWKVGGFQATPASNSVSGAGSSGSDNDSDTWLGGESGSGGGSSISGNAFNGGDGGNWGGGGGGGGGAVDSVGDSGAGGTGGDGIVVVISRG